MAMERPLSQLIRDFLVGYDSPVGDLALALREIVLEEAPDAIESVFRNHPSAVWFGSSPKMKDAFCYIARAKTHVNLGFCQGAALSDPERVFEGTGKVMRHIKFWSNKELTRPFLRRYIRAAIMHQRGSHSITRPNRIKRSRK
jgi:hypothetical protein